VPEIWVSFEFLKVLLLLLRLEMNKHSQIKNKIADSIFLPIQSLKKVINENVVIEQIPN